MVTFQANLHSQKHCKHVMMKIMDSWLWSIDDLFIFNWGGWPDGSAPLSPSLRELYEVTSSHMTKQLDGTLIVACDFSQTDFRGVLAKFHQHVHTPTRVKQYPGHSWQL